jgi:hypothetical protein
MGSALLVGGKNVFDFSLILIEFVIEVENGTAGVSEYGINSLLQQALHYDLCSCHI